MTASPTVSVRGEATVFAEPELATLSISVQAQDSDRQGALDLLSRRAQAVSEMVARFSVGIESSETARLHVYPDLDHKKTEKVRRYLGGTSTTVVLHDFAVLSELLVAAGEIELVSLSGPSWSLRRNSDVYRRARLAAAADALVRARDYAAAFGAELVGLVEIADVGMSQSQAMPRGAFGRQAQAAVRSAAQEPSFDLEPARQEVTGQVEARFLLTQPELADVVPAESELADVVPPELDRSS
jgi:uncharacterized protein YggE